MASTTKKVLRMTFNNASGNAVTITLPEPKASVTAAQIEAVMDQIITKNIFLTSGGELISKRDVKIYASFSTKTKPFPFGGRAIFMPINSINT